MMQMTARLSVGGANGGGGGAFSKSHLKQHQPPLLTSDLKLETVNLFLRKVEYWVRQGGVEMDTTESYKHIDSVWWFMDPEAYMMWPLFESAFRHRFIPEVTITAVRKAIRTLRYSKVAGDVTYFNKRFSELIRILQKEATITHEDSLHDEYCTKLPWSITDQIIASVRMQKKLQPGTPFTLADAMEMVGEFSERTTSHPAIPATPVYYGASFAPPNAATVPTPVSLKPMDLTIANANTRCYRCNGFGHEVRDCVTLHALGCGQAFHVRNGENRSRRDSSGDRNDSCRGGPGTSARSAARSIKNFQKAAGDDASANDDGEDSAVEQEVLDEEDGQGNGNWQ
ncbi:hypothetical protein K440DRAFT_637855 [Wilcoxina mikolae CBS 423.85]|nr:hypothetical protein K440DRAFT_637855 [Wilcoxina mikolae CBS 423.85]